MNLIDHLILYKDRLGKFMLRAEKVQRALKAGDRTTEETVAVRYYQTCTYAEKNGKLFTIFFMGAVVSPEE